MSLIYVEWQETLIQKCQEVMENPKGGEVRIQFTPREYKDMRFKVPIIRVYAENQIICDEVKV